MHDPTPFKRVKGITKEKGTKRVADELGISPQALVKYIRERKFPPWVAKKIEERYGIPAIDLISDKYKKFLAIMGIKLTKEGESVSNT